MEGPSTGEDDTKGTCLEGPGYEGVAGMVVRWGPRCSLGKAPCIDRCNYMAQSDSPTSSADPVGFIPIIRGSLSNWLRNGLRPIDYPAT